MMNSFRILFVSGLLLTITADAQKQIIQDGGANTGNLTSMNVASNQAEIDIPAHLNVSSGASVPFESAELDYNFEAGTAYLAVNYGTQPQSWEEGGIHELIYKEVPGLTLNKETKQIELNGVPCASVRPHRAFSAKNTAWSELLSNCKITNSYKTKISFMDHSQIIVSRKVTITAAAVSDAI